jgi:alginate O-acetyltransferase complex protein AlgI
MLFNSFQFLIFFPIVVIVYILLPHKYRWFELLMASCLFYCAFIPGYLLILVVTIFIDYFAGILIEESTSRRGKLFLTLSIISNLLLLGFFKYYNFFIDNLNFIGQSLFSYQLPHLNIILPIGLSFHTFQAISYVIEVYRRKQKAERNFGIYSLYILFFPQLVAGPIERPQNMLHQFHEKKSFDAHRLITGLQQVGWGLFKKVVVADQLSIYVNSIYDRWEVNSGFTLIFATYCFAFQIYCDFSGYSDIAQGTAHMLGFRLMDNFNLPYFSKSVTEFWGRWHISLSSWLKDYLYISLGGNRLGRWSTYRNLLITMLLGGLWHGASWNFVIWGLLNGLYLSFEKMIGISSSNSGSWWNRFSKIVFTFNLISLTWIFFRANSFHQAVGILKNIVDVNEFWNLRIQDTGIFAGMIFGLVVLLTVEYSSLRRSGTQQYFSERSSLQSCCWVVGLIVFIVLFGVSEGDQFIYFQF